MDIAAGGASGFASAAKSQQTAVHVVLMAGSTRLRIAERGRAKFASVASREDLHLLKLDDEVVYLDQELFAVGVRAMRDQF